MIEIPPAGSIGISKVGGSAGIFIHLGQILVKDRSPFGHTFTVLDDGTVMEAMPGGAKINDLQRYLDKKEGAVIFCDEPVRSYLRTHPGASEEVIRTALVDTARGLEGVPYSFLDYLAIAMVEYGMKTRWAVRRTQRTDMMICSQMSDYICRVNGIHLFDDGREIGEVTPGDIYRYHTLHMM